jgi:hypothetical protein
MSVPPNIAGFDAAQRRLRTLLGVEATFHREGIKTWPPGTARDPETGEPVDSFVSPISAPIEDIAIRCSLVTRPLSRLLQPEREEAALGWVGSDSAALIMSPEDHALVTGAKYVSVNAVRYLVTDFREDATSIVPRVIAFLRKA